MWPAAPFVSCWSYSNIYTRKTLYYCIYTLELPLSPFPTQSANRECSIYLFCYNNLTPHPQTLHLLVSVSDQCNLPLLPPPPFTTGFHWLQGSGSSKGPSLFSSDPCSITCSSLLLRIFESFSGFVVVITTEAKLWLIRFDDHVSEWSLLLLLYGSVFVQYLCNLLSGLSGLTNEPTLMRISN